MTYLSITQTAQRLGVTRQSVWSRIDRGIIQAERIGNGWVVPESEVQRIEEANDTDNSPCGPVGIGDSGGRGDDLATVEHAK